MILLDTLVWIWLLNGDAKLTDRHIRAISDNEASGLGVSVISCWEVVDEFHRDPADRFLVAMARAHNCPILTDDARIIAYAGVRKA